MIDAIAAWAALAIIETGGGAGVSGDANTRDFAGRDANQNWVNLDFGDKSQRQSRSLDDRVMDLERLIYGEPRWNEPGMIKRLQHQLRVSQVSLALNALGVIITTALILFILLGRT